MGFDEVLRAERAESTDRENSPGLAGRVGGHPEGGAEDASGNEASTAIEKLAGDALELRLPEHAEVDLALPSDPRTQLACASREARSVHA